VLKRAKERKNNGVEMIVNDPQRSSQCFRRKRQSGRKRLTVQTTQGRGEQ